MTLTEPRRLAPFEVLWPDHERFRYRAWASENAKRYLVGCIVVGTVDQVLLSSLMVPPRARGFALTLNLDLCTLNLCYLASLLCSPVLSSVMLSGSRTTRELRRAGRNQ